MHGQYRKNRSKKFMSPSTILLLFRDMIRECGDLLHGAEVTDHRNIYCQDNLVNIGKMGRLGRSPRGTVRVSSAWNQ